MVPITLVSYRPQYDTYHDSKACDDCRAFFDDIENTFLGPKFEENAINRMKKMCARLPTKVEQFSPEIICNILPFCKDDDHAAVFEKLHMNFDLKQGPVCALCEQVTGLMDAFLTDKRLQKLHMNFDLKQGPVCALCEQVTGLMDAFLTDKRLQSDIEEFSQALLCSYLPTPFGGLCRDEVKSIIDMIFEVFEKELATDSLCSILGLCGPSGPARDTRDLLLTRMTSYLQTLSKYTPLVRHTVKDNLRPDIHNLLDVIDDKLPEYLGDDGPLCALCETVFGELKSLFTDPSFKSDIENFSQGLLCTFLPTPFRGMCKDEINKMADIFFDFLSDGLATDSVCSILGLCGPPGPGHELLVKRVKSQLSGLSKYTPLVRHAIVQNWAPYIQRAVNAIKPKTLQTDIEDVTEGLCDILPTPLKGMCKDEITGIVDTFFDFFNIELAGNSLCQLMTLCSPGNDSSLIEETLQGWKSSATHFQDVLKTTGSQPSEKDVGDSPQCTLCKDVLGEFEAIMNDPSLKCKTQVDKFTDVIFDIIYKTPVSAK
ncbi:proactivator polypeptide [Plakobranchus ocellatus]|uniref:Proactivator polypeptide n=1 Tax=Plakobranchus ocellatus TaxID=259542 RepID=A0AAV3ZXD7_9GAST|nr:proactivator polypeptide [Plakobranchus ocellatus]